MIQSFWPQWRIQPQMARLALLLVIALRLSAQNAVELPPVDPGQWRGGAPFVLDAAGERRAHWSVGGLRRWYFMGDLPALFSRILILDSELPQGSSLDWILTGDEGGITVHLENGRLRLMQRYYDSFALSSARPPKERYPEKTWEATEVALRGVPRTVEIVMDHRLSLSVSVNGKLVARQTCLMEMRRHQLAWTPNGLSAGKLAGRLVEPAERNISVRVRSEEKHQSIYGFGGIMSAPAFARLNAEGKRQWWDLVRKYNLLIQREYPNGYRLKPDLTNFDRIEDASPHYYGDNFPNGEISDFAYNRRIRELGGKIFFEFWDLPAWAKRPYQSAEGKTYPDAPDINEYVRAVVGYCTLAKAKAGAPPDVVGIQNEIVQPGEVWHEMIVKLREGLDRAGFQSVKIHMPDNSNLRGGIQTALAIRKSPPAWNRVDWAATHVYDFQDYFENPDGYDARIREWMEATSGKPFLSTEFTVNRSAYQSESYRVAFAQAQLYHKNMAMMNASALIYCWTLLEIEQHSFGATRSLFLPDRTRGYIPVPSGYQLRTFGAFSRRLREGMTRVGTETTGAENPPLLATAYEGNGGAQTLILLNRSTDPLRVAIDWPGARFTEIERVSPYLENAVYPALAIPVLVQPGEIVTLSTVGLN
jgi:O-glycosyl hydrolase